MQRPLRSLLFLLLMLGPVAVAQDPAPAPASGPTLVVLNKAAASASLLDPHTGVERARLTVGDGPHEAATSSDGRTVVVCDYGARVPGSTLTVLDVATAEVVRTIPLTRTGAGEEQRYLRPHGIRFLPDGEHVVVTTEANQHLLVVDIVEGRVERVIPTHARISHMVALDPERPLAYVANIGSGSVSVVDLWKGRFVQEIETGQGAEGIEVHPSRPELWVTNRAANTLSVVDTTSFEVVATLDSGAFPIRVAFTPDGTRALVSCAQDGVVEVWDVASRARTHRIAMDEAPLQNAAEGGRLFAGTFEDSPVPVGLFVDPSGREAYVANTMADIVTVLDLQELRVARRLKAGPEPDGMAWVGGRE